MNMTAEWCPSDKMAAAYLTKALCEEKFKHFRQKIMNLKPVKLITITSLTTKGKCSDSQENVENNMSQVSNSLAERRIICVKDTMRKNVKDTLKKNKHAKPLKDRIQKQIGEGMIYLQ